MCQGLNRKPAFTAFIDGKYIPLAPKIKLGIVVLIAVIPLAVFYFTFFQPNNEKIGALESQKTALAKEVKDVEAKAADIAKFQKELEEAAALFEEKSVLLPKDKEIPKLLKDISALGRNAGLDFLTFKPLADVPKDFYAEMKIHHIKINIYKMITQDIDRFNLITNMAKSDSYERYQKKYQQKVSILGVEK